MSLANLYASLGSVVGINIIKNDHKKAISRENGLTASALDKYLQDPNEAFGRRIAGIIPWEEKDSTALKNFRIGGAVHCLLLEGEEAFKAQYPIFMGKRRAGGDWEKFKEANKDAVEENRVLTKEDLDLVHNIVSREESFRQILSSLAPSPVAEITETAISVTFSSGIKLSGILDRAILHLGQEGFWHCEIVDLKTTSGSASKEFGISYAIANLHYDLHMALYAILMNAVLSSPEATVQLFGPEASKINTIVAIENSLIWVSKKTYAFSLSTFGMDHEFLVGGIAKLHAALCKYASVCHERSHLLRDARSRDLHYDTAHVSPLGNYKYAIGEANGIIQEMSHHLQTGFQNEAELVAVRKAALSPAEEKPVNNTGIKLSFDFPLAPVKVAPKAPKKSLEAEVRAAEKEISEASKVTRDLAPMGTGDIQQLIDYMGTLKGRAQQLRIREKAKELGIDISHIHYSRIETFRSEIKKLGKGRNVPLPKNSTSVDGGKKK